MTRRSIGPQAAAILASLSINALLFLGMREVGSLSTEAVEDDAVPLLIVELRADDVRPGSRARSGRKARPSSTASRKRPPSRKDAAGLAPAAASASNARNPTPALAITGDDRWNTPGDRTAHGAFPTPFQRSLSREKAPSLERRTVLAGLEFHDSSFGGLLARLTKAADCGELRSALAHHAESARSIAQTMERLGCRER